MCQQKRLDLNDLVSKITPANRHNSVASKPSVGAEFSWTDDEAGDPNVGRKQPSTRKSSKRVARNPR
jgi:hypothetical protein